MMASTTTHVRDTKPITDHHHQNRQQQQQQQRQQPVLKCPRCDSSNTKFCYYNNYSLSQPRHFCKACKRYWTRGGTLRNVPVGGGCRKNKRSIIKSSSTPFTKPPPLGVNIGHHTTTPATTTTTRNPNLDHHNQNPLSGLLLLQQQQNDKYPRFNNRVSDVSNISRYDHIDLIQPHQVSSFGLGFSLSDSGVSNHGTTHNSIPIVSTYPSMFSGGLTSSSLQQPESIMGFESYGDGGGSVMNDVQIEGTKSNIVWNNSFNGQNENDEIKGSTDHQSSDPASFLWSLTGGDGGEWLDPTTTTICSSLL